MIPNYIINRCKIKTHKDDAPGSIRISEILPDDPMCEDCGKLCLQGRSVEYAKVETPVTHWREYCKNCRCYFNPLTNKYDIETNAGYIPAFREYLIFRDK